MKLHTLIATITLLLFTNTLLLAQKQKPSRAQRKQARTERMQKNYHLYDSLITINQYIIQANTISNSRNESATVSPDINFIKIETTQGTVQIAFPGSTGNNGLGGFTFTGTITDRKIIRNERRSRITVTATLYSMTTPLFLTLNVSANGTAYATVRNMTSGIFKITGTFYPLHQTFNSESMQKF